MSEETASDGMLLDTKACQRMLWLMCSPLMKGPQLNALMSAFDSNHDAAISPAELERLMRLISRRLAKLKPVVIMPRKVTAVESALVAVSNAAAPTIAKAGEIWQGISEKFKRGDDEDDDH